MFAIQSKYANVCFYKIALVAVLGGGDAALSRKVMRFGTCRVAGLAVGHNFVKGVRGR